MTRGELINRRATAGSDMVRAREALARIPVSKVEDRKKAQKTYSDALAFYGQCLWDEEHWQLKIANEEFFT
jgi:hypothetical protein